jgi:vancomycin resistance protein YoaR
MQKNSKKYLIPVILAGIFILFFNFLSASVFAVTTFAAEKTYNKNLILEDIEIGGMNRNQVNFAVRKKITEKLKQNNLIIFCGKEKYVFRYPEINYTSDLTELLNKLIDEKPKLKTKYYVKTEYYLNNIDGVIDRIYYNNKIDAADAQIIFNAENEKPFDYSGEKEGFEIDKKLLKNEILDSINSDFYAIKAKNVKILPKITKNDLKNLTLLRSRFSTGYEFSSEERKFNIGLAASFISGTVLEPDEEFSFNKIVGERSEKRGFKQAKIIFDGKFVDGIGGGVCQLSTTIYNAVLTAGLEITEQHRHTLSVSYIEPSFDAMVNSYTSDLKFKNNTGAKIFIKITADGKKVSAAIYGIENEFSYKRISITKSVIEPPAPEIIIGDSEEIIQNAKSGLISEGYLEKYKKGILIEKKHIRSDKYKALPEIRKIIEN